MTPSYLSGSVSNYNLLNDGSKGRYNVQTRLWWGSTLGIWLEFHFGMEHQKINKFRGLYVKIYT